MNKDIIQAVAFFGAMDKTELLDKVRIRYYANERPFDIDVFEKSLREVVERREIRCNKEENGDHLEWYSTAKYYMK